jgi:hypothetical protein
MLLIVFILTIEHLFAQTTKNASIYWCSLWYQGDPMHDKDPKYTPTEYGYSTSLAVFCNVKNSIGQSHVALEN